ncbi:FA complementation group M [Anticarsia gemmatalis]|uniref:FA complementation group M n=1 Tax=Anticarsia gemmatalis TaxID=129554 RepID=UPI003F76DF39
MTNTPSSSKTKQNDEFEDDEVFDDSSLLANFDNTFKQTSRFSESHIEDSFNRTALNVSALCCDEEISGYDKLTGKTWIYPTNYPVRDYQFNIIQAAILKNTLVSLPTGLGKTFIAAVMMYNFYRWYPLGKIIFTAPTRPLVAQQIEACYNIIAIPPNDTIEMTGVMPVSVRKTHWQEKRVFFATPQVIYNDMKSGICPCDKVRCLVLDEAHKARGNYAYCQIVSTLDSVGHKVYRLLALSATPGSKVEDVVTVVRNLHIAHLELRTEDCIDVAPYSHSRKIKTVVIKLTPELDNLRQQFVEIMDGYARKLKECNILPQNLGNISKGRVVMLYKEFLNKNPSARHPQHNYIMKDLTPLVTLYHALELLSTHGSRVFLRYFEGREEKSWIQSNDRLTALLERLREDLGVDPLSLDRSMLPDGTVPEIPKNLIFGHPKYDKLKEIVMFHFEKAQQNKQDTRAIVFCEYRESVQLVYCLLLQCRPLIMPEMFVGQCASGKDGKAVVSQKQQLRVMRKFREGACNVLAATSVAEEGLDVGSVDLIVCFDITSRSPIRLVQRCGRTGRERGGQVFVLVTEGREHQTLQDSMRQRDGLNKKILQSKEVEKNLYNMNPRMMPRDFTPKCQKMFITVEKKPDPKDKGKDAIEKAKKGQKDLRSMLLGRPSSSGASTNRNVADTGNLITEDEFKELFPDGYNDPDLMPELKECWAWSKDSFKTISELKESELKLTRWLEWQRTLQKVVNVSHSRDSEILSELLQFADAKRFEMPPSTQNPCFNTQQSPVKTMPPSQKVAFLSPAKTKQSKKKQKAPVAKSPGKRDGDIRALFSTATKSTKNYTKLINDLGIQNNGSIPTRLFSLFVDLSLESTSSIKKCYFCENVCNCTDIKKLHKVKKPSLSLLSRLSEPRLPDIDLIDDFDADSILKCAKKPDVEVSNNKNTSPKKGELNMSNNFDLELDFLAPNDSKSVIEDEPENNTSGKSDHFDLGNIDDIFADSSPEEAIVQEVQVEEQPKPEAKEVLNFFGLDSVEDIFADDEIDNTPPEPTQKAKNNFTNVKINQSPKKPSQTEYPISPSILSGRPTQREPSSPILGTQSQGRRFQLSTKKTKPGSSTPIPNCRKQLIDPAVNEVIVINDDKPESLVKDKSIDTTNKSMFTITQLVDMINTSDRNESGVRKLNVGKAQHKEKERSVSPILLTQTRNLKCPSPILASQTRRNTSPILLTQTERRRSSINLNSSIQTQSTSQPKRNESLIILDSDSDPDDTFLYDAAEAINKTESSKIVNKLNSSPVSSKRKLDNSSDSITASPYFNKKPKLDSQSGKQLSLQEKVLAAITSNKMNKHFRNDNTTLNCTVSPSNFFSQKENKNPQFLDNDDDKPDTSPKKNNLSMLQMFRRDSKVDKNKITEIFNASPKKSSSSQKRKLAFDDSEDEFVTDDKSNKKSERPMNGDKCKTTTNHKVRKKKKKHNSFIDNEAELSDDEENSGDELSDDSIGSIIDFICDDSVIPQEEDIQAVYLKSIKSPIKAGAFKIPELPKKYNREDILSQYVEEDAYEMDSFCVDSHIGLTQVNEVSELELAEIILEEKRKTKKKSRRICSEDESPEAKPKSKPKRRQIHSDSEDESE